MTRKDYILIAAALLKARKTVHAELDSVGATFAERRLAYQALGANVCCVADALADANPAFNREKFLQACGVIS